jgi:SAM-dependent methyltransferase
MRRFLRKTNIRQEPLPVAMSGVRMGERVLQIGIDDPVVTGAIAAKPGLSGHAAIVVDDDAGEVRARGATIDAGILADVVIGIERLEPAALPFDAVIVHGIAGQLAALEPDRRQRLLGECLRLLRPGGRILIIEAGPRSGLMARLAGGTAGLAPYHDGARATTALENAGFRPVRVVGERDGFTFTEGLKGS